MNCRQVEEFILENRDITKYKYKNQQIQEHLRYCKSCDRFKKRYARIQESIRKDAGKTPTENLIQKTLQLCRIEMEKVPRIREFSDQKSSSFVVILFLSLIGMTVVWIISLFTGTTEPLHLYQNKIMVFTLLFQNGLMMLFLPILLKRFQNYRIRLGS